MDIVVRGRQVAVSDRFREYASSKLGKIERLDNRVETVEVLLSEEKNARVPDEAVKVELTCRGKGPVLRAEACADTRHGALEAAIDRLEEQLRRAVARRRDHRHLRTGAVAAEVSGAAELDGDGSVAVRTRAMTDLAELAERVDAELIERGDTVELADGPMLVKEKIHTGTKMSLDDALYEMELVGHDFFLFVDKVTDMPSVVYRRRAYDYGVIHLRLEEPAGE